ncbi:hypothetical protein Cfor_06446 [Coptotermes formosanus]|jgi:hypothetical protein|uniref:Uncharacterized protein n=1 Tax=Coptotermes formosanus TaxID=36987 RepID=A0A6L2Q8I3_COPFO|nr:hypothetical protein Cfor_06446 [Coptotermes formosanus]
MTPVRDTCLLTKSPVLWLNKTFLETALRTGYSAPTLNITKYDVKPAVGKGDNYTSDLYRVKVHTASGNVFHLIIKRELNGDDTLAELIRKSTAFLRETHMYSSTAVKLNSILQGALPGS